MSRYSRRSILSLMGAAALLASCGGPAQSTPSATGTSAPASQGASNGGAQKKTLLIGAALPVSGANENFGKHMRQGYELWAEQVNSRGGVLGYTVELRIVDDKSDPTVTPKLYDQLATDQKVTLFMGPYGSDAIMSASTIAEERRIPMLVTGSLTTALWNRGYKYLFGLSSHATSFSYGALEIARDMKLNRVGLVSDGSALGRDVTTGATTEAPSMKLNIIWEENFPPGDKSAMANLVERIKKNAPDLLVISAGFADTGTIVRQVKDAGVKPHLLFLSTGPDLPEFSKSLDGLSENILGLSEWEPAVREPGSQEFVSSYTKKYGGEPSQHAASAYAAGQVLEATVKRSDTPRSEIVREWYGRISTATIVGPYLVDIVGRPTTKVNYTVQWQGGRRVIVWPNRFTNNAPRQLDWK